MAVFALLLLQAPAGELAFMRGGKVWLTGADGGGARVLAENLVYALDRPLLWAPGGARLVFWDHTDGWMLWAVDPADGTRACLTSPGDNRCAAFSPDGRQLAWMRGDEGLCLRSLPDGPVRVLSAKGHRDLAPAWSPDGRWIAFEHIQATDDAAPSGIYLVRPDGSGERFLAAGGDPAWAPGGTGLLYTAGDLYLDPLDGAAAHPLTRTAETESAPAWSPDGHTLAFLREGGGHAELRLMNADGGGDRLLAAIEHAVYGNGPRWSPDGAWIAWMDGEKGQETAYLAPSTGGERRPVATGGALFPVWRPR